MNGEQLTLLPAESLASLSVWPGSRQAQQMTVTSGQRLLEYSRLCDRDLSWLRTLVASSAWRSTMCLLTWQHKVTPAGRSYYQLRASAPRIDEIESGLWPTPTLIDATMQAHMKQGQKGRHAVQLSHLANSGRILNDQWWEEETPESRRMWPTPNAANAGNDVTLTCSGDGREKPNKLGWAVAKMMPTPTVDDANNVTRESGQFQSLTRAVMWPTPRHEGFDAGAHRGKPDSLHSAVKMFPTPRAIYGEHPGMTDPKHLTGAAMLPTPDAGMVQGGRTLPEGTSITGITPDGKKRQVGLTNVVTGKLNPAWVSRMMGFPDGWMDVGEATP